MLLGALLDCGLQEETLRQSLADLKLPGWKLSVEPRAMAGLSARLVRVDATEPAPHRHLAQIRQIIKHSALSPAIQKKVLATFTRLAEAEARVHGTTMEEVHFHEVGSIDAIIDIVGVISGFDNLSLTTVVCSPLPMPSGWVACEHGSLPLPAPAVCDLLRNIPVYGTKLSQELVTPTGAALVAELAESFGSMPPMIMEQTGYGAGTMMRKDGRPNMLRLITGRGVDAEESQQVLIIETDLDDWNPELWPHVSEKLLATGALDVSLTPQLMKKGRPGYMLRVITTPADAVPVKSCILTETSTLGLRFHTEDRMTLPRRSISVQTPWGAVRAKKVHTPQDERITPEYEDCRRLALENKIPLQTVYDAVIRQAGTTTTP